MNEICEIFLAEGLPCGPVQSSKEVSECPHVAKRNMFIELPESAVGTVKVVGSPFKMVDSVPQYSSVPRLGEHTRNVLQDVLGYTDEQLTSLRQRNVI